MVRGTGKVRVGLLGWEPDFLTTYADWGDKGDVEEVWDIPASGWLHIYALRRSAENTWGMVRIECDGGEMHLDNVLCEADWLKDWRYFDGDSTYGSRERLLLVRRREPQGHDLLLLVQPPPCRDRSALRLGHPEDDFTVTDEEVQSQGFVYSGSPLACGSRRTTTCCGPTTPRSPCPTTLAPPSRPTPLAPTAACPTPGRRSSTSTPTMGTVTTPDAPDDHLAGTAPLHDHDAPRATWDIGGMALRSRADGRAWSYYVQNKQLVLAVSAAAERHADSQYRIPLTPAQARPPCAGRMASSSRPARPSIGAASDVEVKWQSG